MSAAAPPGVLPKRAFHRGVMGALEPCVGRNSSGSLAHSLRVQTTLGYRPNQACRGSSQLKKARDSESRLAFTSTQPESPSPSRPALHAEVTGAGITSSGLPDGRPEDTLLQGVDLEQGCVTSAWVTAAPTGTAPESSPPAWTLPHSWVRHSRCCPELRNSSAGTMRTVGGPENKRQAPVFVRLLCYPHSMKSKALVCPAVSVHLKSPMPLIEKSRASCPGGRFPLRSIHQVIIAGLKKLYDCMFSP